MSRRRDSTVDHGRRRVLKGALGGVGITLGLPLLDLFLDDHGTALAGGVPLPLRFGTWFWGCGMNPERWVPESDGPGYDLPPELAALGELRSRTSVLSGFATPLDGRPNLPHWSGVMAMLTGSVPTVEPEVPAPTLDVLIARERGLDTRFRSLELSATGVASHSYSRESQSVVNPSGVSPLEVYQRLFGEGFQLPGGAPGPPDPRTLLRTSVLSTVQEDAARLEGRLGSHDRQRLDQFFTSLRQLERQIELSLDPPDLAACSRPAPPAGEDVGSDLPQSLSTHALLTDLLVHALQCDQTRVFNVVFSWGLSGLRKPGELIAHHELTHDEVVDEALGYQPLSTEFVLASMDAWAHFVRRLAETPEAGGTLLDHCLVMAHSESSFAKSHSIEGLPVMLAGEAGGLLRTGVHVRGNGEPVTRIGLTVQQALGLPVTSWGTGALEATQALGDLLA